MNRLQGSFVSIEQVTGAYFNKTTAKIDEKKAYNVDSFGYVLQQVHEQSEKTSEVTFSKHANERLASRNINLNEEQIERLNKGILQAKEKSIKESLVMMDDIAFIVNVKNNTVITAMDQSTNDSNVFTNIDGAVIV